MSAPSTCSPVLVSFIDYFETLTPQSLKAIDKFYSKEAHFKDPFNETTGIPALGAVFEDMFEQLHDPVFKVVEVIEQTGDAAERGHQAFLVWDFTFRFKSFRSTVAQQVRGSSHIVFNSDGKVLHHVDYWDAAGQLYEKIPILGKLMRWLRNRLAVG